MPHVLERLGLDDAWQGVSRALGHGAATLARVVSEQRGLYLVHDGASEAWASVAGRLRHAIDAATADRPAVGDFVVLRPAIEGEDSTQRVIEHGLTRRACIVRKAAGKAGGPQVIAANVDTAFIVCGLSLQNDREVNARRIERLAAMALDGGARPVIVLNKADAHDDVPAMIQRAQAAAPGLAVHAVSAKTGAGLDALAPYLEPGRTVVLIGSSGAGKSTLANSWLGAALLATAEVGADGRGRHTSRARQLLLSPRGVLVIDTPGVREAGLWGGDDATSGEGVERAFDEITALAAQCRFSDCQHAREPGCAVQAALAAGQIDAARLGSFHRLRREQAVSTKSSGGRRSPSRPARS
jgi:ribosome biogenesis GTPase